MRFQLENVESHCGSHPPFNFSARGAGVHAVSSAEQRSAIVDSLIGFARQTTGQIRLDDQPIHDLGIDAVRIALAWVCDKPFLFDDSILANLSVFTADGDEEDVLGRVVGMPRVNRDWLGKKVGNKGEDLPAEERAYISLLRARIQAPRFLIVGPWPFPPEWEMANGQLNAFVNEVAGRGIVLVAEELAGRLELTHVPTRHDIFRPNARPNR